MMASTLDGVVVQCAICANKSNGFHFGVFTCGACKIFFKRNFERDIPHRCVGTGSAEQGRVYLRRERIASCPRCRLEQCLLAGMSFSKIKRGRRAYTRKTQTTAPAQVQPDSTTDGALTGGNSPQDGSSGSQPSPTHVKASDLPSPYTLPQEGEKTFQRSPMGVCASKMSKPNELVSDSTSSPLEGAAQPEVETLTPGGSIERLPDTSSTAATANILQRQYSDNAIRVCAANDAVLALDDVDVEFDMVVKLLNPTPVLTPYLRLSPTDLVNPEHTSLLTDGVPDEATECCADELCQTVARYEIPETGKNPETGEILGNGEILETGEIPQTREIPKNGEIPVSPSSINIEVNELQDIFTNICTLSEFLPPDYHQKLPERQQNYLEYRKILRSMNATRMELIPIEDFLPVYRRTGYDSDGRLGSLKSRIISKIKRCHSHLVVMSLTPGFQNLPDIDKETIACGAWEMYCTLTEHHCFDLSRGLHTTPEGVTHDIAEMRKELPAVIVENLFRFSARVKSLKLTALEEHLLKSVLFFNPDCCLTVEGAKQVEKHREFYTQVLDYVYCSNTSRKGRASLDQLFNTVEELKEQTKESYACYKEFLSELCQKAGSSAGGGATPLGDFKLSEIGGSSGKYRYLDPALRGLLSGYFKQYKIKFTST